VAIRTDIHAHIGDVILASEDAYFSLPEIDLKIRTY
jgi:hypothetical protein